jgi:hypothetical protein
MQERVYEEGCRSLSWRRRAIDAVGLPYMKVRAEIALWGGLLGLSPEAY